MLRITAPLPIGLHILAPAIPRVREMCIRVSIDLHLPDPHIDLIEEGIDIAFRVGELADSRLTLKKLESSEVMKPHQTERRAPLIFNETTAPVDDQL
jgi:DNA-binding transcriptional LysR family regulator